MSENLMNYDMRSVDNNVAAMNRLSAETQGMTADSGFALNEQTANMASGAFIMTNAGEGLMKVLSSSRIIGGESEELNRVTASVMIAIGTSKIIEGLLRGAVALTNKEIGAQTALAIEETTAYLTNPATAKNVPIALLGMSAVAGSFQAGKKFGSGEWSVEVDMKNPSKFRNAFRNVQGLIRS